MSKFQSVIRSFGLCVFYTLASSSTLFLSFCIIAFLLDIDDKNKLQTSLFALLASTAMWGITYLISILGKVKDKKIEFINLIHKIPLILLSTAITGVYIMIMFFFFGFITVSSYGKGGIGADADIAILMFTVLGFGVGIIAVVMYKVMKTNRQNISLTIYNQFSVLKWASLIVMPFGVWASYYFYHTEGGTAWVAMFIWMCIFYWFYKMFNRLSEKVHRHITQANVNRIVHEKKNKIVSEVKNSELQITSVADELNKLNDLFEKEIITKEEFEVQKVKLLRK